MKAWKVFTVCSMKVGDVLANDSPLPLLLLDWKPHQTVKYINVSNGKSV